MSKLLRRVSRLAVAAVIAGTFVCASTSAARADLKAPVLVPAELYGNGCSQPGPNVLLDQSPLLHDPSPWAAPWFFVVKFRPACDLHDAAYDGGWVFDPATGVVRNTVAMSRLTADQLFLSDLMSLCDRQIGWNAPIARAQCYGIANTYYAAVRNYGSYFYDANPLVVGIQASGTRPNN